MININEINSAKDVEIICTPAYKKTIKEVFRKAQISHIRLLEAPDINNIVKIYLANNQTIELHYSVGVSINSSECTSNEDLFNKLLNIFATP